MASIFEYPIAYVEDLSAFAAIAPTARAAGVKGLAIKLHDSEFNIFCELNRKYLTANANYNAKSLRGAGFSLGAWSVPRLKWGESPLEVSQLYKDIGLSFVVFETEWHYKTDGGKLDVADLLRVWRALRPKAWTGFAVEGGPPTTFNHAAVQADPFSVLLPENYWLQNPGYDVRACLNRCVSLGWDLTHVKPTLTGVEGHTMHEAIIRASRGPYPLTGIMLWRGDMLSAKDYRLVGLADNLALR